MRVASMSASVVCTDSICSFVDLPRRKVDPRGLPARKKGVKDAQPLTIGESTIRPSPERSRSSRARYLRV